MSKFAERLSELIKNENLTTVSLQKATGISRTQLGKYISNFYEPSLNNAIKISNYFKCSLDYLLGIDNIENLYDNFLEPNYEKFITRYKELLKLNNTNHNKISKIANFNRNNLIYWQKHKSLPTLDILYKIAICLNTKVEYLIGRID